MRRSGVAGRKKGKGERKESFSFEIGHACRYNKRVVRAGLDALRTPHRVIAYLMQKRKERDAL